jgi:hypothetical protein
MSINVPTNTTSEQVAQGSITQTEPLVQENNTPDIATENVADINNVEPPVSDVVNPEDVTLAEDKATDLKEAPTPSTTLTPEQMEAKLKEYEIKEQEAFNLKQRLGIKDVDTNNVHLDTIEATIDNRAQQAWIGLCNKYGVDYTPEGLDKSSQELLAKDPRAFYEWQSQGKELYQTVEAQKSEIHSTRVNHEIGSFVEANRAILDNSPIVKQIIGNYIQENFSSLTHPQEQLGGLMEAIKQIYAEAVEVGKHVAKYNDVANDKSAISGSNSIATANTSSYQMNDGVKVFTRDEIRRMDTATFDKYEKQIQQQMLNGQIK